MRRLTLLCALAALFALLTTACERNQSLAEALEIICNPENHLDEDELPDTPMERMHVLSEFLDEAITNDEARELMDSFRKIDDITTRQNVLREAMDEAGVSSCPFYRI